jgi:hypothetical protein
MTRWLDMHDNLIYNQHKIVDSISIRSELSLDKPLRESICNDFTIMDNAIWPVWRGLRGILHV